MDYSLGALFAQKNDEGFELVIYYLSQTLIGVKCRYNPVKKECLALVFAVQKTRHYLIGQGIHIISRVNPTQILMMKPGSLNCRLANWGKLVSQYNMTFIPLKAVKVKPLQIF